MPHLTKSNVIISMSDAWGIRNVLRSGLYEALNEDYRIVLAIPEEAKSNMLEEGFLEKDLLMLRRPKYSRLETMLARVLKSAHSRNHPVPENQVFSRWKRDHLSAKIRLRNALYDAAGFGFRSHGTMQRVKRIYQAVQCRNNSYLREDLLRLRPVSALSTSFANNRDQLLFSHIHQLGVPSVIHVLSHDNLTSRSYIPLEPFSLFLVWHQRMKNELQEFYAIPEERIRIVGTPQFDFHVQPRFFWSRQDTLRALDIPANSHYFVYNANHNIHTPSEPELIKYLLTHLMDVPEFSECFWVLRPHPLDDYSRWHRIEQSFSRLRVTYPWHHTTSKSGWGLPSIHDIAFLSNLFRHAEATLQVASTTALDSAVVDTPAICVGFHPTAPRNEAKYYYDAHFSRHYTPIVESGAVTLVTSINEVIHAMKMAITQRDKQRSERRKLVEEVCGLVDGHAATRIAELVVQVSQNHHITST